MNDQVSTSLYGRLGLRAEHVAPQRRVELLGITLKSGPLKGSEWMYLSTVPEDCAIAALAFYFFGNLAECREYAERTVAGFREYLLGDWRRTFLTREGNADPNRWRHLSWLDQYRSGVFWSICLGDWESARLLSTYPSPDEREIISERKSELPWYLLLASYLRGDLESMAIPTPATETVPSPMEIDREPVDGEHRVGQLKRSLNFEQLVQRGSSKRHALLSTALREIDRMNPQAFERSLDTYLKYYRKQEFPRRGIEDKLSIDGSILVHLAERKGMAFVVGDKYLDHIVRLTPQVTTCENK